MIQPPVMKAFDGLGFLSHLIEQGIAVPAQRVKIFLDDREVVTLDGLEADCRCSRLGVRHRFVRKLQSGLVNVCIQDPVRMRSFANPVKAARKKYEKGDWIG